MNEEDEKLQKHLIDEMMKVSKTNPDVMIYMGILMKNYEKLEEEIKRLKEDYMILQNASDKVEEEKDREIERLQDLCNKYEKEHKTTYEIWKKDIYLYNSLVDRIDKALSYLRDIGNWLRDDSSYRAKLIDILQGSDKE